MKIADFVRVIRAAEFLKNRDVCHNSNLWHLAQAVANSDPSTFKIEGDEVKIPRDMFVAFDQLLLHPYMKEDSSDPSWGGIDRPFVSSLPPNMRG
jgi:hypothetical protein